MSEKEYIERGALLSAIGEERAVLNGLSEYGYLKVIREVPAADVEPVVRCPECVNGQRVNNVWTRCAKDGTRRLDSFYCAHGKERER